MTAYEWNEDSGLWDEIPKSVEPTWHYTNVEGFIEVDPKSMTARIEIFVSQEDEKHLSLSDKCIDFRENVDAFDMFETFDEMCENNRVHTIGHFEKIYDNGYRRKVKLLLVPGYAC